MIEHLSAEEITQFRARQLSARALAAADRHLSECPSCRAALAATAPIARARVLLAALAPDPAVHLSFDRIEGYVDGRAQAAERAAVEAHLGACLQCAREVAELTVVAPALARPLPQSGAANGRWTQQLAGWLGGSTGMRAAFAVLVAAAALTWMIPHAPERDPGDSEAMRTVVPALERGQFDEHIFARASRDVMRAYRSGDHAALLAELRTLDANGDAIARTALGVAYALGLGVAPDPAEAERLWLDAAGRGEASAAHDLGVLYARGLNGPPDPARAEEWYARALERR